jgi:hypothetical protein
MIQIPSGLPSLPSSSSSPADSPKSTTSQGTTVTIAPSMDVNPDIANLEDAAAPRGKPPKLFDEDTYKTQLKNFKVKLAGIEKDPKQFNDEFVREMRETLLPYLRAQEVVKFGYDLQVNKKKSTLPLIETIESPIKAILNQKANGTKQLTIVASDAVKFLNKQASDLGITGTGLKRLGLASRRPRKGETLPMNSVLLNQLDKGHLNVVTKKGNQVLKQKNISDAFKRIVNAVMKSGTFEADDYKKIEDIEIPSVNQFIIQSDAVIPPDTPYKTTSDHVKDVKSRYNILVGQLASGNSGRIVREEMKEILKEMWRLKQITFKAYKSRVNGLKDFE